LRALRWLAGFFGTTCLVLAMSIFVNSSGIDVVGKIVFGGIVSFLAFLLLTLSSQMKLRWVPLWALGWWLAAASVLQLPFWTKPFGNGSTAAKFWIVFWCCTEVPLQLALGAWLIKTARRGSARRPADLPLTDSRAPVLYLRPFAADSRTSRVIARDGVTDLLFNTRTEEELVAEVLGGIGPCVAIGRPGERLPELGFNRFYVSQDKWRDTVLEYLPKARLVVLMGGASENFSWEVEKALELVKPQQLLLFVPANTKERRGFSELLKRLLPQAPPAVPKNAVIKAKAFIALVYFASDWTPSYAVPQPAGHFRQRLSQKLTGTLHMALKPVYRQLCLVWKPPPLAVSRIVYDGVLATFLLFIAAIFLFTR
jgi:hypothetical protein